ncbi:MAG: UDP-N-acetylglucosamine 2-epimerase (non-hydrolyzing) [Bacillota bacterium]
MNKLKILSVFGTRPEAVKMAPVVRELAGRDYFESRVAVTGQHREMLDQVLTHFQLRPDYDLAIMQERQTLNAIFSRTIERLDGVLASEQPDVVLVHGDTATTIAASLAAFNRGAKIGRVEAGLRSFDKWFPYPEEIYRRLADVVGDLHFAPTLTSRRNLLAEGIGPESIFVTGNSVIDALLWTIRADYRFRDQSLNELIGAGRPIVLVECHRRENFGAPMVEIAESVREIAVTHPEVETVVSAHLNPEAGAVFRRVLAGVPGVHIYDPFDYPEWSNLMNAARILITDSGGAQEEAPALGVPVLLCRDTTERPEAVVAGTVKMVGPHRDRIVGEAHRLLTDPVAHAAMAQARNPYGDGEAARRIADAIAYYYGFTGSRPDDYIS